MKSKFYSTFNKQEQTYATIIELKNDEIALRVFKDFIKTLSDKKQTTYFPEDFEFHCIGTAIRDEAKFEIIGNEPIVVARGKDYCEVTPIVEKETDNE